MVRLTTVLVALLATVTAFAHPVQVHILVKRDPQSDNGGSNGGDTSGDGSDSG
ncbi:hypothetical protein BV25DRAFT_1831380 [Artomyces pyxidatus]|uniref:Uncharacterized protein n=1 Tax=Artomyces pyxidatus TaxID=48021 RepID=A0ACB8SLS7_9AGAM|nr:hypothetical protein BV25DRAFT_1831380 [Artomyces pyxidatus]